ncbi:hypothetical protein WMY93_031225 [Mugilogobius chulae]|uniref:E3 ubiquitin-protein ligase TRIM39-like n=1 Tax=Mugilogobius chulae TaxID=88201 RepID=A0AAW0MGH1_9GOBI
MACGGVPYEEHFWCCICLDVFTDPVTLPCGHNFCKSCISQHWTSSQEHQCVLCRERIPQNTELRVNIVLSQMSQQMKTSTKQHKMAEERREGEREGEIWCDVCEERAVKSCLMCLTTFCEVHLAPHYKSPGLRRHHLIEPVKDLEKRLCQKHNRPLRFFCHSDQTCICQFCSESEHSRHAVVSLEEEGAEKRRELSKIQDRICQMTTERRSKMELLGQAARNNEDKMAENMRDCVQALFKVSRNLEKHMSQLIDTIQSKQNKVEKQTGFYVSQLEEEICELVNAKAELEESKNTIDDFQLIQNFESLQILPKTFDLTKVEVCGFQRSVVDEIVKKMEETVVDLDKFWMQIEFKCAQQFAVDTFIDAKQIYPYLNLSDSGKKMRYGDIEFPDRKNLHMLSKNIHVLAQQEPVFGKFYFEIPKGNSANWNIGVVREKNNQNFEQYLRPENGYWVIQLTGGVKNNRALTALGSVKLRPRTEPQTIGVFVDYEIGLVSFYNSKTAEKIYRFEKCDFKGRVFAYSELVPHTHVRLW